MHWAVLVEAGIPVGHETEIPAFAELTQWDFRNVASMGIVAAS